MAFGMLVPFGLLRFQHGTRWTPTGVLLWQAQREPGNILLWNQLGTRTLTPAQRDTLVEGVIERLPASRPVIASGAAWLAGQIIAGTMSVEQRERALDVLSRLEVVSTSRLEPDGRIEVELQGWHAAHATGLSDLFFIESVRVGEGTAAIGPLDNPVHAFAANAQSERYWPRVRLEGVTPRNREIEVRVKYWHATYRVGSAQPDWEVVRSGVQPSGIVAIRQFDRTFTVSLEQEAGRDGTR